MTKFIIGIDPGKNGGIVALSGSSGPPKIIDITAMPQTIAGLWEHFLYLGFPKLIKKEDTYVFIEKVHSMPTDGRRAAYSFGYGNGCMDTVLDRLVHVAGVRIIRPNPVEWQRYFGLAKEKEESKYDYKKRILSYAKAGSQVVTNSSRRKASGEVVGGSESRDVGPNNGKGLRNNKQEVAHIKWPGQTHTSKLTLKTCDAFLIALYGYQQIMEEL